MSGVSGVSGVSGLSWCPLVVSNRALRYGARFETWGRSRSCQKLSGCPVWLSCLVVLSGCLIV